VYRFQGGRALVERQVVEGGQAGDGLVDPRVAGWLERRLNPFHIHMKILPHGGRMPARLRGALPSRVNGTADLGARRT
jgi:hypothetical protein